MRARAERAVLFMAQSDAAWCLKAFREKLAEAKTDAERAAAAEILENDVAHFIFVRHERGRALGHDAARRELAKERRRG